MTVTLLQLAELVQGTVQGDADIAIQAARPLGEARAGDITFVEDDKHARQFHASPAAAAVVSLSFSTNGRPLLRVADPLNAFVAIVRHLHGRPEPPRQGIDPLAVVHPTARLGADVSLHPFAVIGEGAVLGARCTIHSGVSIGRFCRLGDDVTLYPHVVLYDDTVLGNRVVVHANAVLGADGFGYRFQNGRHVKVPQLGHVEIADDVEIGACTTIDRGAFTATRVGEGTKIDNLVQIAHNCQIGKHNLLISQVGIAGSSTTGAYVVLGGQAGVDSHIHIGDNVQVAGQAGVIKDVAAGLRLIGTPALLVRDHARFLINLERIPQIQRDVRLIKERLGMTDHEAAA